MKPDDETELSPASYSTKNNRLDNFKKSTSAYKQKVGTKVKAVRKVPYFSTVLVGLLFLVLALGGGYLGGDLYNHQHGPGHSSTALKQQYVSDESALITQIAKNVGQSVVSINVESQSTTPDIFGFGATTQSQESAGTGFIINSDGLIVTNRHVVPDGTTSVSVTLADGTRYDNVQVVGRTSAASAQDIAFLKIQNLKGKTLVPVSLGDSSKVQVGDRVIAIGNALGQFQNTVTSGIISGFGRDVTAGDQSGLQQNENLTDLFQTDAAINEGNSGGPLVNINGEVIGINTATASNAQNIGFAQPINDLKGLINSVLSSGKLEQPYLGVRYVSLTDDIAYEYNLSVKRGAYVVSSDTEPAIVSGSPADKAGIQEKDVITKVNNIAINENTSLTAAISHFKVGEKVTLTIVRGGKTIHLQATLAPAPTS